MLVVSDSNVSNGFPNSNLNNSLDEADKVLEQNKKNFDENINGAKQTILELKGAPILTTEDLQPEEFKSEEGPASDTDVASPISFAEYEEPSVIVTKHKRRIPKNKSRALKLRFPKNRFLRPIIKFDEEGNKIAVSPVDLNSEGVIVRATRKADELHYILAPYSQDPTR